MGMIPGQIYDKGSDENPDPKLPHSRILQRHYELDQRFQECPQFRKHGEGLGILLQAPVGGHTDRAEIRMG
jgi:hypothetical protein